MAPLVCFSGQLLTDWQLILSWREQGFWITLVKPAKRKNHHFTRIRATFKIVAASLKARS